MTGTEEGKSLKYMIMEELPRFNSSFKSYLNKHLKVEGGDGIVEKISIHAVFYSKEDDQCIRKGITPFALCYAGGAVVEEIKGEIRPDEAGGISWWERQPVPGGVEDLWIVQKYVRNSIDDDLANGVNMVLAIVSKEKLNQRETYLVETLKDLLEETIEDLQDFKEGEWINKLKEKNMAGLMDRYVKKVFSKWENYPGISLDDCRRLSYRKDEGRECSARIYLGKERGKQSKVESGKGIICFQNGWCQMRGGGLTPKEMEDGRIRYLRKMMELCKKEKYLVTWFDDENDGEVDLFGIASAQWLDENQYHKCICFDRYGEWHLAENDETLLLYADGNFYFSKQSRERACEIELSAERIVKEERSGKFNSIIKGLSDQKHGTSMIILEKQDLEEEVKNLCETCHRGTRICGGLDLEQENLEFLEGLTSVDGALLVNEEGVCHAFGVILDGKAQKPGNPAKGARHNSALTYINMRPGRGAVIVSEDQTIQIKKS